VIDIDRGRNCYNYGKFGYLAQNCKNYIIVGQGRRIEYRDNRDTINNLKEKENLVILD